MTQPTTHRSLAVHLLVVCALALRVAIPAGYMPASVAADGWYLQWCPSGVSTEVMAALFDTGDHHSHHHHHAPPGESEETGAAAVQCEFGPLGADAHTAPTLCEDCAAGPPGTLAQTLAYAHPYARKHSPYRSRAPPPPRPSRHG